MATPYMLTSDHINYMVFRYLQEAGFTHTAFTFAHESSVTKAPVDPNNVAPGTLIALIQKGMQYLELESNLEDGDVDADFKMLTPEELLANDIDQLRQIVQDRREEERAGGQTDRKRSRAAREKEREKESKAKAASAAAAAAAAAAAERGMAEKQAAAAAAAAANAAPAVVPMEEELPANQIEVPASSVVTLHGHESEVYMCAWSPTEPLLASGSGDATARVWNLAPGAGYCKSVVLQHEVKAEQQRDMTALDWNNDGSLLATGSYDGLARVWTKDGKLRQTFDQHTGPIFALKWNKKGDMLLSGSVDKKAIVWDVKAGEAKQVYELHDAPTLDVDWRNSTSFATCSSDTRIHICRIGDSQPIKTFSGHTDEVNAIRWDPSGALLASCSVDSTAKVWSLKADEPLHDLAAHEKEVYTLRWSPSGPGSLNPNQQLLLATASFDTSVRLWEAEQGKCVHTLRGHADAVYSIAFSPNGKFLASGSFDKKIHIWSVADGSLVKTCQGEAGIYEVCWNSTGDKVAACFANKTVCVVDLRL